MHTVQLSTGCSMHTAVVLPLLLLLLLLQLPSAAL